METLSTEANYALQFINQTQRSVFLTGKAGTGKTTLLHQIRTSTHKNTVVVAPTGIAALNANGVTIHSLFQLPFHAYIPDSNYNAFSHDFRYETKKTIGKQFRMSAQKKAVIRNMELLIIDEVSMLRSDLLDAIDCTLQGIRKNHHPFGGVQVLFIGDLLQLPPVVNDKEWAHLKKFYQGKFFFHAHVIQHNPPLYIELAKIYRQSDEQFIGILNNLRNNKIAANDIQILNQYVDSQFTTQKNKGYVTLTTHNHKADQINAEALLELPGKTYSYIPEITGEFPEKSYPLEAQLQLKVGAQIMFVKNDVGQDKQYYNGKMGQIQSLSTHEVIVFFPDENRAITVEKYEWQNLRYTVDSFTKEVTEEVIGTFVHYPIKLAWAITIHKSQGLTFDKAAIDVSQVFMPGQAYVALSRLRSLDGLVLLSPLQMNGIVSDQDVMEYAKHRANSEQLAHNLAHETIVYVWQYLKASFSWDSLVFAWQQFNQERAQYKSKTKPLQNWSKTQHDKLFSIQDAATKFGLQLDRLLQNPSPDWPLIKERVEAAYGYFFPVLDEVETALVDELIATQQRKKSKALFDELQTLEELQTTAILQLHKAKLVICTVADGKKLDKHSLQDSFFSSYKAQKVANRLQEAQDKTANLLPDLPVKKRYTTKNTAEKKPEKKSSIQETYALWEQKYSVEDIAKMRLLTPQTIVVHLTKLIEEQFIAIESVLPLERIALLEKAFDGNEANTLQAIKDQLGDSFSWDELKLFKASLSSKKTT
jgi:hypothetical protein